MLDKEYIEKSSWYTSVADAIRNKKGTTDPILRDDFASEISSISVGEETPYYDGTVIIEKAESVLGLRRFKSLDTINAVDISDKSYDETIIDDYAFNITEISFTVEDVTLTISKISCMLHWVLGYGEVGDYIFGYDNGDIGHWILIGIRGLEMNEAFNQFNVLSTANTTVDEWLLANTEGVSV